MNTPTTSKMIRVSVPVSPEVLARFRRLGKVAGQSVAKAMSEWLEETQTGLDPMIDILEKHKRAPFEAIKRLQFYSQALDNTTRELFDKVATMGPTDATVAAAADAARQAVQSAKLALTPPSCNTGGKVPKTQTAARGGKSGFPLPPAKVQAHANTNGMPPKAPK